MRISPEVAAAITGGRAVALESTIFSRLGLPDPAGRRALERCTAAVRANAEATAAGITGPAVTPFVLDRIAAATDGRSVPANLALAERNAAVAARIAVALAG